ncbi:hypothetical protein ACIFOC_00260 [Leucobacter aridicollis]|uniref:alpha/beta fold hydrolase n=1 Tax=Leucobacter aridicollis TaxID=283878 RepID=UPI0037C693B0
MHLNGGAPTLSLIREASPRCCEVERLGAMNGGVDCCHPENITDYDIEHLAGGLAALLDHFEYASATFVGHDWGAFVVWSFTLLHPEQVDRVVALSMPTRRASSTTSIGVTNR